MISDHACRDEMTRSLRALEQFMTFYRERLGVIALVGRRCLVEVSARDSYRKRNPRAAGPLGLALRVKNVALTLH